MAKGKVIQLFENKGYGFIKPADGSRDLWFHASAVTGALRFAQLRIGTEVEFSLGDGPRGKQARNIRAVAGPREMAQASHQGPYRFLNPYNFVQFLSLPEPAQGKPTKTTMSMAFAALSQFQGKAQTSTPTATATLLGCCAPPPHDRYVGLSGEITCKLENVTPLFISDSHNVRESGEHKSVEFYKADGQPALPASSLRGMVRGVFEAVTNSCLAHLTGQRLSKHIEAGASRQLWPARVTCTNGVWQLHIMAGATPFSVNGPPQGHRLPAAWLMRYNFDDIKPSPTLQDPANRGTLYANRKPVALPAGMKHGDPCHALLEPMKKPDRTTRQGKIIAGFDFWNVRQIFPQGTTPLPVPAANERLVSGWLCSTNQNIENKHDERVFFAAVAVPPLELPKGVRDAYKDLIADYQSRHKDNVQELKKRDIDPARPFENSKGERVSAYSRFILESHSALKDGDLVYAMLDGTDKKPRVVFIAPVSIPRVSHEKSIDELLKRHLVDLQACRHSKQLCPACRVFGWVHNNPDKEVEQVAYAGRVCFSIGALLESAGSLPPLPLAILASPKPTTVRFYLQPKDKHARKSKTWAGESFEDGYGGDNILRGRKFYRHHGAARETEYRRAGAKCDDQNRTVRDALAPGARFKFTVRFENLAPLELGALLWALQMEKGCHHRLGLAKPLGFGSVTVTANEVKILNPQARYESLSADGWEAVTDWQKQYVDLFKREMASKYGEHEFDALANVKDLRAILSAPPGNLPVHYPRTAKYPDPDGKNFEWFMGNNRKSGYKLPPAAEDKGLPVMMRDGTEL